MVMRRAVWCVALLRLLLLPISAGAVRIKECGTGSVTLDETRTPAFFNCDGFMETDTVTWTVGNTNTSRPTVITCLPQNTTCHDDLDLSVTRNGSTSSLRIRGNYRTREGNNSIICSAASENASCSLNVIAPATLSDCEVNADNWTVAGSCRFKATYSTNGVYTCTWQEQVDGQINRTINGKVEKSETIANKQYYDGSCSFAAPLSPQQREGLYNYTVNFFPGPDNKSVNGSFYMRSPGNPVTNCPQYVYEGQSVSCGCLVNPSSPGVPPATAHWQDKSPGQPLVISDVTRNHSGQLYTCMLTWGPGNGTVQKRGEYKLHVAYVEAFPWGIVAGAAGGGLNVAVIGAVVVVVRRRQQARNRDDIFEEEPESAYDRLRQSRIGLRSIYSALNHAVDTSETDNEGEGVYDKLRQAEIGSRSTYCVIHVGDSAPHPGNGEDC